MDIIISTMSKPKVVDLDKYGIGEVTQGLMAQGGGASEIGDMEAFWDEIGANIGRNIHLTMRFKGNIIDMAGTATVFDNDRRCRQVSASFLLAEGAGFVKVDSCIFKNTSNSTFAYMKVT